MSAPDAASKTTSDIKVLFVTTWFPTDEKPGSGPFVWEQAKAVAQQGVEVKILQIRPVHRSSLLNVQYHHRWMEGIEVLSVFVESRFSKLLHFAFPMLRRWAVQGFKTYFKEFIPDLIHAHVIYPAGFIAYQMAHDWNIPFHISEHWSQSPGFLRKAFWGSRAEQIYNSAYQMYPVSDWLQNALDNASSEYFSMKVIPNVVDASLFHPKNGPNASIDLPIKLLCVMSFEHSLKRPDLLFDALAALPAEQQSQFEIHCIGARQKGSDLAKRIKKLNLSSSITLSGPQPKQEVAQAMREADYLVHPTEMETFGLVVAEALATGTPVICSAVGALPELVNEKRGMLVQHNTISDWKEALQQVLEQTADYDRKAMSVFIEQYCSPLGIGSALVQSYRASFSEDTH